MKSLSKLLEDIRRHKHSVLNEADDDDKGGGVDDILKDLGGSTPEKSEEDDSPDEPGDEENGGEASKDDSSDKEEDKSDVDKETDKEVEKQKDKVEAETVEETDSDINISLDKKLDDLFIRDETGSLDASNKEEIVVEAFAQKVLRIADNIDKLIDLPKLVLDRAKKYILTKYGERSAAEFEAIIRPEQRKYGAGGTEEFYQKNTPEFYAPGALSANAGGGSV